MSGKHCSTTYCEWGLSCLENVLGKPFYGWEQMIKEGCLNQRLQVNKFEIWILTKYYFSLSWLCPKIVQLIWHVYCNSILMCLCITCIVYQYIEIWQKVQTWLQQEHCQLKQWKLLKKNLLDGNPTWSMTCNSDFSI